MRKPIIETVILAALFAAIPFGCVKEQAEPDVLSGPLPERRFFSPEIPGDRPMPSIPPRSRPSFFRQFFSFSACFCKKTIHN